MPQKEHSYLSQLNKARLVYQQRAGQDKPKKTLGKKVINLVEAIIIVGLVAFIGNDLIDWLWGLLDLGSGGIALVLDWTVNNGLNFITTGIISLWLWFKKLRPDILQKALIGAVVALVLDTLPFVGLIPVFTIQTIATIIIVNYSEKLAGIIPGGKKALSVIGGRITGLRKAT